MWNAHQLQGNYKGYCELHLFPDVLLIYTIEDDFCILSQI
ncbi:type II toxin-antitoxin system YafQ family toxin [Chryseobacterium defluvii]|nr:type II toxin-antitoxin system YafQ family toxin [Chryseobacterium defluvii]